MTLVRALIAFMTIALPCLSFSEDRTPQATAAALPPGFDPSRHMRVAEVRDGMTGYGVSVFKGTTLERFDVKVISVLHNFNPKYDVVLIDCKGANLEHTGSIAGMSGSPVYLKDDQGRERMIGAFAYGWPMMKDPIAGVQPIEYMLTLPTTLSSEFSERKVTVKAVAKEKPAHRARWSVTDPLPLLTATRPRPGEWWSADGAVGRSSVGSPDAARLQPLATPLMAGGFSPRLLEQFGPALAAYGLVTLQAGGGPAGAAATTQPAAKLEPGSVLAVPLMTGDADMTVIGTVTDVIGDRVYGFGHAFNNEGPVSLPMGSGSINAIIANLNTSFKIGTITQTRGTLTADQTVGVAGKIGPSPRTIPVDLKLSYSDGSNEQQYHFELALHPKFTPLLAAMAIATALSGSKELPQYHTVEYDLNLSFDDGRSVRLENSTVNAGAPELFAEIGVPIMAAADNPFERVGLTRMTGTLHVTPEAREAKILAVSVPRAKYQPGESAKVFVTYRAFRGAEAVLPIEFEIPKDLPDGQYQLVITDWQAYLEGEKVIRPFRFTAENVDEVFTAIKDLTGVRHNAVYVQLLRKADGIAVGRTAMPHLPSSRREVLMGAGLSDVTLFLSSTLKVVPTDLVMSGSTQFVVTVDRQSKVDTGPGKPILPAKVPHAPVTAAKPDETKPKPTAESPPGTQPSK